VALSALPFVEPIAHGCRRPGAAVTTASQHSPTATATAPAGASRAKRRRTGSGLAPRYSATSAGSGSSAWKSFTAKATPISAPAATSAQRRSPRAARSTSSAAASDSATATESIVSLREVSTEIGSTARAAAPAMASATPNRRRSST
jgi:hypothetical protein